jgi:NDP-sugar pyrophosphorylase family protein
VGDRQKVVACIRGRPFLTYLLDLLGAAGVRNVVLCTGYLGEQVRSTLGDEYRNLRLRYSKEESPLGTAGALRLALPLLASDPVLVMNGDSFCDADLAALWAWHRERGAAATLFLTEMPDTKRYGRVEVDADGHVTAFAEKGSQSGPGWINAGIYLLRPGLISTIPANRPVSLETEAFPSWIGRGLYGYKGKGRFLDIGTPESYERAEQFFASWTAGPPAR